MRADSAEAILTRAHDMVSRRMSAARSPGELANCAMVRRSIEADLQWMRSQRAPLLYEAWEMDDAEDCEVCQ